MSLMTSILFRSFCLILLLLPFFSVTPHALADDTIRINGTGCGLEMMKPLMEAYSKASQGVSFSMEKPLGSSGAIKALLAGAIDIAVTSKPLTTEEIAKGVKLRDFGKTPLAIVTGKNVHQKNISTKELENIYAGKITKWPNGETIRIVMRPKEEIETKILRGLSPGMDEAVTKAQQRRGMIIAVTDPESNMAIAKTAGGIGAASLPGVIVSKVPLNILALNGVKPSRQTIADGTYPLARNISFATTGRLPHAAAKFLDFVYSQKGRAIAEKVGVLITAHGR